MLTPALGTFVALGVAAAIGACTSSAERAAEVQKTAEQCRAIMNPPPFDQAQWERTVAVLHEKTLPALVEDMGVEDGVAEFNRRVTMLREAVELAAQPDPYFVEVCRQWIASQFAPRPATVYSAPSYNSQLDRIERQQRDMQRQIELQNIEQQNERLRQEHERRRQCWRAGRVSC